MPPPPPPPQQETQSRRTGGGGSSRPSGGAGGSRRSDDSSDGEEGGAEVGEKKVRFVWTPDLHCRFENAVHRLGVAHAKPQAIQQLMNCEGEGAPTRQNIKSHLQKYRLLLQKQGLHDPTAMSAPPPPTPGGGGGADGSTEAGADGELDGGGLLFIRPLLHRQQMELLGQLEVHTKLCAQLLEQRATQAQIGGRLASASETSSVRTLSRSQLHRLARHVLLQRQMLQHLYTLLHACTAELHALSNHPLLGEPETDAYQYAGYLGEYGDGGVPETPSQDDVIRADGGGREQFLQIGL